MRICKGFAKAMTTVFKRRKGEKDENQEDENKFNSRKVFSIDISDWKITLKLFAD